MLVLCVKIRRALALEPLSGARVLKTEGGGVQHQSRRHGKRRLMGIHVTAQDRVAQFTQVNTQLVLTPGDRHQQQSAAIFLAFQYPVAGEGVLAILVTDLLQRPVGPVAGDR